MAPMTTDERVMERTELITELAQIARRWLRVARQRRRKRIPRAFKRYGFVIADGTLAYGEPCFMIVTGAGESMPLTGAMVRSLSRETLVMADDVIAMLDQVDPLVADDEPVRELELMLVPGFARLAPRDYATVSVRALPSDLEFTRWSFTAGKRPAGWPR